MIRNTFLALRSFAFKNIFCNQSILIMVKSAMENELLVNLQATAFPLNGKGKKKIMDSFVMKLEKG